MGVEFQQPITPGGQFGTNPPPFLARRGDERVNLGRIGWGPVKQVAQAPPEPFVNGPRRRSDGGEVVRPFLVSA